MYNTRQRAARDGMQTDTMAGNKKTIAPPNIPQTPSKAINDMLKKNCNHPFENPFKAALAYYICGVFQVITMAYNAIYQDKNKPSHRMWMISCGIVSAAIILKSYFIFKIIMGCTGILYGLLYYGSWLLALFGVGLGVSGMVFFDKEGYMTTSEHFRSDASRVLYDTREEVSSGLTNRYQEARDQFTGKDD